MVRAFNSPYPPISLFAGATVGRYLSGLLIRLTGLEPANLLPAYPPGEANANGLLRAFRANLPISLTSSGRHRVSSVIL